MTPEAAILSALNARAATLGASFPALVYREIGEPLPAEYVMIDHLPNQSDRPMVDRKTQDMAGIYQLTLARQVGEYEIVYREQAAQIAAHFMGAIRLAAGGYTITITKADVGRGLADGARWLIPVSVHYRLYA